MSQYNLIGYCLFAFVATITPGPNNYLLFSFGKNYGFRKTIPVMTGVFTGFATMLYICGYGIGGIVTGSSHAALALKVIASVWLLYLAFLVSKINVNVDENEKPRIGFVQTYFMQFLNPKAWIMAINGAAVFLPKFSNIHLNVFVFAVIFSVIGVPCMMVWVTMGGATSQRLKSPKANRRLGYVMFSLMLVSIATIWL